MVSLQSVNVAIRVNPLYRTASRHIQMFVLLIAEKGNWVSAGRANSKMRRYLRSKPMGGHLQSPGSIFPGRAGVCQSCANVFRVCDRELLKRRVTEEVNRKDLHKSRGVLCRSVAEQFLAFFSE